MPALTHHAITIADLRQLGFRLLSEAGIANARREVVWLLERALETTGLRLQLEGAQEVPEAARERAWALLDRRAEGEPLQYLLGSQDFYGLDFQVGPAVLIPRPETELLVAEAVKRLSGSPAPLLADIGTGSGCIAVALAYVLPQAEVFATDISAAALAVARRNAARHGVAGRVQFLEGDLLAPLHAAVRGRLAAVISNPPYIKDGEMAGLQREVTKEPRLALAGGPDGLHVYRRLVQDAGDWLAPQGVLLVEVGQGQAAAVREIAVAKGWAVLETVRDAAGIERVVCLKNAEC